MNLHVKFLFSAWLIVGCCKNPPHSAAWISSAIENTSIKTMEEVWRYEQILTLQATQKNCCISKTSRQDNKYPLQMRCIVRSILSVEEEVQWSMERFKKLFPDIWRDAGRMKEHHFHRWSQIASLPRSKAVKMPVMPSCSPRTSQVYFWFTWQQRRVSLSALLYIELYAATWWRRTAYPQVFYCIKEACKECRAPREKMWFQCGQGKLAGDRDKAGFML